MSRATWAPPHMAVGYQPACFTRQGAYPCFPIMPRFGLTGLGRGGGGARGGAAGARGGRGGGGPVFVGSGPGQPKLGGRTFGRGFRFPSSIGPFSSDGSWGGMWNNWWPVDCPFSSYPFYSHPVLPQFGLGAIRPVNPLVPRYGMSGLGLFDSTDYSTWGWPEGIILGLAGLFVTYLLYAGTVQAKQTVYRGQAYARRRRVSKAKKYREKAKRLEEGEGRLFGLI